MGKANGVSVRRAQRGQQSGELPVAGRMNPLEETPVPAGRERHVFGVWQTRRPATTHHAHRQVLVDHDHSEKATRASVRVVAAAKDRIRCEIRVKCGLKLVRKISARHPGEHRPPFFRQARVSCPTASAALFRNIDDGHLPILPRCGAQRNCRGWGPPWTEVARLLRSQMRSSRTGDFRSSECPNWARSTQHPPNSSVSRRRVAVHRFSAVTGTNPSEQVKGDILGSVATPGDGREATCDRQVVGSSPTAGCVGPNLSGRGGERSVRSTTG